MSKLFEAVESAFNENKIIMNEGEKYRCTKSLSHPNMGNLFKKGQVYELTNSKGNTITLGGYNISKDYLDTHFEKVNNEAINEDDSELDDIEQYIFDEYKETNELPDYEYFNDFIMNIDKETFDQASANVQSVIELIVDNIYTSEGKDLIQLSDEHIMNRLTNETRSGEEWFDIAKKAMDSFEENTGVELYAEGRSSRHMCVDYTYENAKRYNELVSVLKDMADAAVEEFNRVEESENLEELDSHVDPRSEEKGWKVKILDVIPDSYAGSTVAKVELFNPEGESQGEDSMYIHRQDVKIGQTYDAYIDGLMSMPRLIGVPEISREEVPDMKKVTRDRYLSEQILADGTESELRTLVEDLKAFQSEIKHSIVDQMISFNAKIQSINESNGLLIDEIETDGAYANISSVISDIEYELKNSEWSKEEAEEDNE